MPVVLPVPDWPSSITIAQVTKNTMSRYLPPDKLKKPLEEILIQQPASKQLVGRSVRGLDIDLYRLGAGDSKILAWSQTHGNESTSTKALLKLADWLVADENKDFLEQVSFYFIPQLNPDGSKTHQRHNSSGVDLNRDALKLSQPESLALGKAFGLVGPGLCLNLHDQRTVYAAGSGGRPATLSFLAPSTGQAPPLSPAYQQAARLIAGLGAHLDGEVPRGLSRFGGGYNPDCFGEYFISRGVPTILFEAGHYPGDYQRDQTEHLLYSALKKTLEDFVGRTYLNYEIDDYGKIPLNQPEFFDLIIKNLDLEVDGQMESGQDVAVMFFEKLVGDDVRFLPLMVNYGQQSSWRTQHPYFNFKKRIDWRAHHTIAPTRPVRLPYQADITNHYNFIKDSHLLGLIKREIASLAL